MDLLPKDSAGYLEEARRSLAAGVAASAGLGAANVRHVALVSAATGYGVEELITRIQQVFFFFFFLRKKGNWEEEEEEEEEESIDGFG